MATSSCSFPARPRRPCPAALALAGAGAGSCRGRAKLGCPLCLVHAPSSRSRHKPPQPRRLRHHQPPAQSQQGRQAWLHPSCRWRRVQLRRGGCSQRAACLPGMQEQPARQAVAGRSLSSSSRVLQLSPARGLLGPERGLLGRREATCTILCPQLVTGSSFCTDEQQAGARRGAVAGGGRLVAAAGVGGAVRAAGAAAAAVGGSRVARVMAAMRPAMRPPDAQRQHATICLATCLLDDVFCFGCSRLAPLHCCSAGILWAHIACKLHEL
jgi:hypothetical protein